MLDIKNTPGPHLINITNGSLILLTFITLKNSQGIIFIKDNSFESMVFNPCEIQILPTGKRITVNDCFRSYVWNDDQKPFRDDFYIEKLEKLEVSSQMV